MSFDIIHILTVNKGIHIAPKPELFPAYRSPFHVATEKVKLNLEEGENLQICKVIKFIDATRKAQVDLYRL